MAEEPESRAGRRNCPQLGLVGDPSSHLAGIAENHLCYAGRSPVRVDLERQTHYCLSNRFVLCPRWALGAPLEPLEVASPDDEGIAAAEARPPEIPARRAPQVLTLVLLIPALALLSLVALGGPWGPFPQLSSWAISPGPTATETTLLSAGQSQSPATIEATTPSAVSTPTPAPAATARPVARPTVVTGTALSGGSAPNPTPTVPPEPSPAPLPALRTYLVPAGDTLSLISARFGVPIEEIMKANGIQDRNLILSGRTLVIP